MKDNTIQSMKKRHQVQWPSFQWISANPLRFIAFGFGSGLVRPASGTWGTLIAWVIWLALSYFVHNTWVLSGFILLSYVFGIYCCHKVGKELQVYDHVGVVWDEVVAFWTILLVIMPLAWPWQIVAFALFRFFDIVKPDPIRYFDNKFKNGFGVMWDDTLAAAYTLFVLAIFYRIWGAFYG